MSGTFPGYGSAGSSDALGRGPSPYVSLPSENFNLPIHSHVRDHEGLGASGINGNRFSEEHDPHFYPDQALQIPYEVIANSFELSLEGITEPAPRSPESEVDISFYLRDDIEYADPPPEPQTPDPSPHLNPTIRPAIRHDDEGINTELEEVLYDHRVRERNIRGPQLRALYAHHWAGQVAEPQILLSWLDENQFQIPNRQVRYRPALLPARGSELPGSRSSNHTRRGVFSDNIEARSFFHEEPHHSTFFDEILNPQLQDLLKPSETRGLLSSRKLYHAPPETFGYNLDANSPIGSHEMAHGTGFDQEMRPWLQLRPLPESFKPLIIEFDNSQNIPPVNLNYRDLGVNTGIGQSSIQNHSNPSHSNLGNEEFKAAGREYIKLRYLVPQPLPLPLYQRSQEVLRLLGPETVVWLEYNAEKTGFVKARKVAEKELIKTTEEGYSPPLGYDPLDNNLMAEQESREAARCHNAAVEVFGLDAFGGGNKVMMQQICRFNSAEDLGLSSEEFHALLDDAYSVDYPEQEFRAVTNETVIDDIQIGAATLANNLSNMDVDSDSTVEEHQAKRPRLSAADLPKPNVKPSPMPQSLLQSFTTTTHEESGPGQNDSLISTASFGTAVMDIQDLEEDEISAVPTRPKVTVPKRSVKDLFTKSGYRTDDVGDPGKGKNEVSMVTTIQKVTLPGIKSTKDIFAAVKAVTQSQTQESPSPVSRTSYTPQSAEWSWGKAVNVSKGHSFCPIVPKNSTEAPLWGLKTSDNINIGQNDQSLSREKSIHSYESRDLGLRLQSHQQKLSQSNQPRKEQSWGYPGNPAVDTLSGTSSTASSSFEIQAKSGRGRFLTGDKLNSQPAIQKPVTNLTGSPSRQHAPHHRGSIFRTPEMAHISLSRTSSASANSMMQSDKPFHSPDNSTMSSQTTPTNEGSMTGQQSSPITQYNSPTPTGYGEGMRSGSFGRPTARPVNYTQYNSLTPKGYGDGMRSSARPTTHPVNNTRVKHSVAPQPQPSLCLREIASGNFVTRHGRECARAKFNKEFRQNPNKNRNLMIIDDPNAYPAELIVSGPIGSNVRGAMSALFPGYRFFAKMV